MPGIPFRSATLGRAAHAIDDETASPVVDGTVKVVSDVQWKFIAG